MIGWVRFKESKKGGAVLAVHVSHISVIEFPAKGPAILVMATSPNTRYEIEGTEKDLAIILGSAYDPSKN